jgi:hypothetical protein
MLSGNYLQHPVACLEVQGFSISFTSKDCIFLQPLCRIFGERLTPLRQSISHPLVFSSHWLHAPNVAYLFLPVILAALRFLDIIVSYSSSKCVVETSEFKGSEVVR